MPGQPITIGAMVMVTPGASGPPDTGTVLVILPPVITANGMPLATVGVDLELLSSDNNLLQALLLRFLTHTGELAILGHPDYGSRLFQLIGELNSETNRNRAKLYVLEALAAEPRVKEVKSVIVTQ